MVRTWLEMEQFENVDLSESYVLGWRISARGLEFDLDVALTPEHQRYKRRPEEVTSWLPGLLLFPDATNVIGLMEQANVPPAIDAHDERDYGNIDSLSEDGRYYVIAGEFGKVALESLPPTLVLSPSPRA